MAFVLHISFDNTRRLKRQVYYFRYRNHLFKLIQHSPRKHADVLLTIIPTAKGMEEQFSYSVASEFLSALSWENNSQIAMRHSGGYGARDGLSLRSARCSIYSLPRLPSYYSIMKGYTIDRIPKVETAEQRTALTLFRDGYSSNHTYISFLLFWQVLDTAGRKATEIATQIYGAHKQHLHIKSSIEQLNLGGRDLGDYLWEDCRNAIAHIKRAKTRTSIKPDNADDNRRILISTHIICEIARYFISHDLNLSESLYLVRCKGIPYPLYTDEAFIHTHSCKMAYR